VFEHFLASFYRVSETLWNHEYWSLAAPKWPGLVFTYDTTEKYMIMKLSPGAYMNIHAGALPGRK
jgi:hypothetical protein